MYEAYSVAIKLSLKENVTMGLVSLSGQFRTVNDHIRVTDKGLKDIEGRLRSIKLLGMAGGITLGAGVFGLSLFEAPIKAAREYELAFTKFKALNLGDVVNKQADQFARGANIMGVAGKDLMQTLVETVGMVGNFDMAKNLAPTIAALNQANAAIYKGKISGIDEGSGRSLMQFIDRRGGTKSPEAARSALDVAERLVTGSGGFIQFKDLGNFSQMGGTAFRSLSDQGVLDYGALIMEQGGSRAGQSMMSIYQNLVAGRTTKRAMAELASLGLGKIKSVQTGTMGGKPIRSNILTGMPEMDLLQSDGPAWFRTVFLPLLAKKGITKEKDILRVTNDLLSNRNASGQASIMDTQTFQMLRDSKMIGNAMGVNAVIANYKNDPNSKFSDLTARWTDTMRELGMVTLPKVVSGTEKLNASLKGITNFESNHPKITSGIAGSAAGLAGLAAVGGSLMLIAGGFKALKLAMVVGKGVGLGGQLLNVAGGLGAIASRLSKLGVLGLTATAAYEGATALGAGKLGEWLSDKLYNFVHPYDPNAATTDIHTHVHIDGQKIATVVTKHQTKALGRPQTGPGIFDGSMGLMPAGDP